MDGITDSMDMSLSTLWEMVEGKGSLECCSQWGRKKSDVTWRLNNNIEADIFQTLEGKRKQRNKIHEC